MLDNTQPQLDPGTQLWFERIGEATDGAKPCPVPEKYFNVLKTWGYVEGSPSAAKLTGSGLGIRLLQKQEDAEADKQAKAARKKSSKRKKK